MLIPSWLTFRRSAPARRRPNRAKPRSRLAVEPLEERALLSASLGWAQSFGMEGSDYAQAVATDSAGNVYVTGGINFNTPTLSTGDVDFDPGPGVATLGVGSSKALYLAKYSAQGDLIWVEQPNTGANTIALDSSGDIYLAGRSWSSSSGTFGSGTVTKLDPNGNMIWTRSQIGGSTANFYAMTLDSTGNAYAIGDSGYNEALVAKVNADGSLAWTAQTTGNAKKGYHAYVAFQATGIGVDAAGNVYSTGRYVGTVDFDPGPNVRNLSSVQGYDDVFVWKLNNSGGFVWADSLGTNGGDGGKSLVVDGAGNVYVEGYWGNPTTLNFKLTTNDFDPGSGTCALPATGNGFLEKLDTNGRFVWAETLSIPAYFMVMDGAGNLYLAGGFTGTVDFDPGPNQYLLTGSGTNNTYVLKLDSAGNFLWAAAFNSSSGGNGLRGIAVDPMGDVYLVGNLIGTADFDPGAGTYNLTSVPGTFSDGSPTGDFFVVKLTQ